MTHIGEREECTAVHAGLAVDVDDTPAWASQIGKHRLFKGWIPVQNLVLQCVGCTETGILVRIASLEPYRTVLWEGTVDDMRDATFIGEFGSEKGPGTHENAGMEVGRRLPNVVWYRDQHCLDPRLGF